MNAYEKVVSEGGTSLSRYLKESLDYEERKRTIERFRKENNLSENITIKELLEFCDKKFGKK